MDEFKTFYSSCRVNKDISYNGRAYESELSILFNRTNMSIHQKIRTIRKIRGRNLLHIYLLFTFSRKRTNLGTKQHLRPVGWSLEC